MKQMIIQKISQAFDGALGLDQIEKLLEIPPSDTMGDFAFPCFSLAKIQKKNPSLIAQDLKAKIENSPGIEKVDAVSGYVNIFIDKIELANKLLTQINNKEFGMDSYYPKRVVVEFASPNTNKPLHLGHLRNISIGESVARILDFNGAAVVRCSINNDRGVHICKSMLAYQELGNGETPESSGKKSDHLVGDYYVKFSNKSKDDPSWDERAKEMLRQWENGNPEVIALWRKMNTWAFDGFKATYKLFGIHFDKEYYESQIYTKGKEIIQDGLQKGIFSRRSDNAVFVTLDNENLGEKVLLRPDGTSVYIVQDLYLALLKNEDFQYDTSIYVVGNEQDYHFNVLKAIFKRLGYDVAEKIHHLSYGMVELPEGKMKSREGTVVDADDLILETQELAKEEIKTRYQLTDEEMKDRSLKIALAAIKYQLLKIDITKNMVFNPKVAISFEGDTGPYLLYSYARASSILRKAGKFDFSPVKENLSVQEVRLLKKLGQFTEVVHFACDRMSPSSVAGYAFETAQLFNEFYHACPVIGSEQQNVRLHLVNGFREVIKKCLWILGIEPIEEM